MAKHTLKMLRSEHRKIFKYVWPFYNMHERVKYLSRFQELYRSINFSEAENWNVIIVNVIKFNYTSVIDIEAEKLTSERTNEDNVEEKDALPYFQRDEDSKLPYFQRDLPYFARDLPYFQRELPYFARALPYFAKDLPYFQKRGLPYYYRDALPYYHRELEQDEYAELPYYLREKNTHLPYFQREVTSELPYFARESKENLPYYLRNVITDKKSTDETSLPYYLRNADSKTDLASEIILLKKYLEKRIAREMKSYDVEDHKKDTESDDGSRLRDSNTERMENHLGEARLVNRASSDLKNIQETKRSSKKFRDAIKEFLRDEKWKQDALQ